MQLRKFVEDVYCVIVQGYNDLKILFIYIFVDIVRFNKEVLKLILIFIFIIFKNIIIFLFDDLVQSVIKIYFCLKLLYFNLLGLRVIDILGFLFLFFIYRGL